MPLVGVNNEPLLERAIFAYDGTDYRVVKCDASGQIVAALEAGSTIEVTQDTATDLKATVDIAAGQSVEVTQDTAADLNATVNLGGANEYGVIQAGNSDTNLGAGSQNLSIAAVPSGEIWEITVASAKVISATCAAMFYQLVGSSVSTTFFYKASPVSDSWNPVICKIFAQAGDVIRVRMTGLTAGDDAYFYISGQKVKA